MTTPVFPKLGRIDPDTLHKQRTFEDSSLFKETIEDQSKTTRADNGYVYTRPKFTRKAKRKITTGFTEIDQSQKETLDAFYHARMGGTEPFNYEHPVTKDAVYCRFVGELSYSYMGSGESYRWSVEITLQEV